MSSTPRRARRVQKLALPFALGLLLAFIPLPKMSFVTSSVLNRLPLPVLETVGAQELPAQQAAADEPLGDERVAGTQEDVPTFTTIGVLLDSAPTEPILIRTKDQDGEWDEWRELHAEGDEGPDLDSPENTQGVGAYGTAPIWVDDAVGYELSVGAEDAEGAEVALVRDELQRTVTEATPLADAALPRPFDIHLRAEWGARATETSIGTTVKLAVVHHDDGSNDYSPAAVPGILRSIQAFHMDGRGWSDIAYNFVVDKYGGIWEGRGGGIDRPVIGAHAMGFNTNSVGVVALGDYTQASPTQAMLESISQVVGWKLAMHNVDPAGEVDFVSGGSTKYAAGVSVHLSRVVGHQDVGLTSCPGSIEGSLDFIRARGQEWTTWVRALSTPVGSVDGLGVAPGTVTATGWAADPDGSGPMTIAMSVGGVNVTTPTNRPRPDVQAAYPFAGPDAGFAITATNVPPGYQDMCVTAINQGYGNGDLSLMCRPVVVPDPTGRAATGAITATYGGVGRIIVSGTVNSPSAVQRVDIDIDGVPRSSGAGTGGTFWAQSVGVLAGTHKVCATVVAATAVTRIDCQIVSNPGGSAMGSVDSVTQSNGAVRVSGWALDPETVAPIIIAVTVDGRKDSYFARDPRPDIAAVYPGYGEGHGFNVVVPAAPGAHNVCVEFGGVGAGSNVVNGCTVVK